MSVGNLQLALLDILCLLFTMTLFPLPFLLCIDCVIYSTSLTFHSGSTDRDFGVQHCTNVFLLCHFFILYRHHSFDTLVTCFVLCWEHVYNLGSLMSPIVIAQGFPV